MTLSGATTPGQSGPGNEDCEGVLFIPQISSITGASPSDCTVTYLGQSFEESYLSADVQSVYSTVSADWTSLQEGIIGEYMQGHGARVTSED